MEAVAEQLQILATSVAARSNDVTTLRTAVSGHLADAAANWSGDRRDRLVTAGSAYLQHLAPLATTVSDTAVALDRYRLVALEVASDLTRCETQLATAHTLRATVAADTVESAELAEMQRSAESGIAAASMAWTLASAVTSAALGGATTGIRAFSNRVAIPPGDATSPTEYAFALTQYAALTGTPLAELDPTGRAQAAADDWITFLSTTGIGEMYFTVLETARQGDIGDADDNLSKKDLSLAASDPERLRDLLTQWGAANGIEFDDRTLDHMVGQLAVGAVILQAAGPSGYEDIDDDLEARGSDDGLDRADLALAAITGIPPVVALNLAQVENNPTVTNSWWTGLTSSTQRGLVTDGPASLGNTNGIPATVRDEVNQATLDEDRERLEAKEADGTLSDLEEAELENIRAIDTMIESHEQYTDPTSENGEHPVVQLYVYEPAAFGGDGRVAISLGDLDTADHIAVGVPGMLSETSGLDATKSQNLFGEVSWAADGDSVAILDWQGYDAPSGGITEPFDISGVVNKDMATAGAQLLADDVAGINAMRPDDDPHLTVVGNSYGSTTSAIAADEFDLEADDLVLSGSPGAGNAETADDFVMGADHTYVVSASNDIVTYLGNTGGPLDPQDILAEAIDAVAGDFEVEQMGNDPAEDDFGATRLEGEYEGRATEVITIPGPVPVVITLPGNIDGHQHYYDAGSESLYNISAVIAGEPDSITGVAEPRHKEPTVETHSPVEVEYDGDWWDWTPGFDVDQSNEPVVEVNMWPVDPESDRTPSGEELTHADD